MTTQAEARKEIIDLFRAAWEANPTSAAVPLAFDDVEFTKPSGEDANGRALPWARISVRHFTEEQDTIGAPGNRRYLSEGEVTIEIYVAPGGGHQLGDTLSRIAKLPFRGSTLGVWFPSPVRPREIGMDASWFRRDVVARFKYEEKG